MTDHYPYMSNKHNQELHAHPLPSNRSFGFVFTAFFAIVGLLPLWHGGTPRYWALIPSCVFLIITLCAPSLLTSLNRWWTQLGLLLNRIVSPIALGILFYCVVAPTGLLVRFFGKDPLLLKFDHAAKSYWIERTPPGPDPKSFKNQF